MRHSVLLTVYNREAPVLLSTLRSLWRSLGDGDQVVVVNDGSTHNYDWAKAYANRFANFLWVDIPPYPACRISGGYNNPARAFNAALEAATCDNLFIMSSDVLVTPAAVAKAKSFRMDEMAWAPKVIDIESGMQYCGPLRCFPMPWFLGCSRKHAIECGGWDEAYLDGMCYEDNDFVGRLMLRTGRFIGDWDVAVYHQSHNQPAYSLEDQSVIKARDINREYTMKKWKGIPFESGDLACFTMSRKPYVTGDVVHEVVGDGDLLQRVVANTRSPFVLSTP